MPVATTVVESAYDPDEKATQVTINDDGVATTHQALPRSVQRRALVDAKVGERFKLTMALRGEFGIRIFPSRPAVIETAGKERWTVNILEGSQKGAEYLLPLRCHEQAEVYILAITAHTSTQHRLEYQKAGAGLPDAEPRVFDPDTWWAWLSKAELWVLRDSFMKEVGLEVLPFGAVGTRTAKNTGSETRQQEEKAMLSRQMTAWVEAAFLCRSTWSAAKRDGKVVGEAPAFDPAVGHLLNLELERVAIWYLREKSGSVERFHARKKAGSSTADALEEALVKR